MVCDECIHCMVCAFKREFDGNDDKDFKCPDYAQWRNMTESGEWIADAYMYYRCSECGYEHDSPEYTTPFCPGCGAKMTGEEDNE